jgi:hypothetical protein
MHVKRDCEKTGKLAWRNLLPTSTVDDDDFRHPNADRTIYMYTRIPTKISKEELENLKIIKTSGPDNKHKMHACLKCGRFHRKANPWNGVTSGCVEDGRLLLYLSPVPVRQ